MCIRSPRHSQPALILTHTLFPSLTPKIQLELETQTQMVAMATATAALNTLTVRTCYEVDGDKVAVSALSPVFPQRMRMKKSNRMKTNIHCCCPILF